MVQVTLKELETHSQPFARHQNPYITGSYACDQATELESQLNRPGIGPVPLVMAEKRSRMLDKMFSCGRI